MKTSEIEPKKATVKLVSTINKKLTFELADHRTIAVPLAWFPRLVHGTPAERDNWRLIGSGTGIHWPDLDEDISVDGSLAGRRSGETKASLQRWRRSRVKRD